MVKEQVLVKQIHVNRINQVVDCQIKLPTDAKKIIGIETGVRIKAMPTPFELMPIIPQQGLLMPFNRQRLIGELGLQSFEATNLFYSTQIKIENNEVMADFTSIGFFTPKPYTHQSTIEPDSVLTLGSSTIIRCIYKNLLKPNQANAVDYVLSIYLWLEIGKVEAKKCDQKLTCHCAEITPITNPHTSTSSVTILPSPNPITPNLPTPTL